MTNQSTGSSVAADDARPSALSTWRTPVVIVGFGCLIATMSFGPRSSLGFFLTPLSAANHWGRDVFAFALALQNLLWGIGQPLAGMIDGFRSALLDQRELARPAFDVARF